MNSPYYTIQNFGFNHYNPYSIEMEYPFMKDGKEITKKLNIVPAGIDVPASKTITFTNTQLPNKDIIPLKFYYSENQKLDWLPNKLLNSYNIHLKKKKEKDWKFTLKYDLDINCIPKLDKANIIESKIELVPVIDTTEKKEEKKDEKKPEEKKDDKKPADKKDDKKPTDKKDDKKPADKKDDKKPTDKKDDKKPENKKPEAKKPETKKPETKKVEDKKKEEKPKMKEKKIETETQLDIDVVETLFGTSKGILEQYLKREKDQNKEDEIFREASNLKNSLEQYIYSTKEKLDSQLKGYYTDPEKGNLTKLMDELMNWLYSEDEKLYDKPTLEAKSKNMKTLGDEIYKRCDNWNTIRNNYNIFESTVNELSAQIKTEEDKLAKKQFTYITKEDSVKINKLIKDAVDNAKKKHALTDKAPQIKVPPVQPDDVKMLTDNLRSNVQKVYDDAKFKVEEAERKRKEEEKKKKEEEEKKKKEEEEKKKKEEEEKKKKEGDKKDGKKDDKKDGKKDDKKDGKKDDKKNVKKDSTNKGDDVKMKDANKSSTKKEDKMDVE